MQFNIKFTLCHTHPLWITIASALTLALQERPRIQRFLSFDEYLSYDEGTENLYELFNGKLIEVPPESGKNAAIAAFLLLQFTAIVGHLRMRPHGLKLEVRGEPKKRYPDLTTLKPEHVQQ